MNARKLQKELIRRYGRLESTMQAYYTHLDFRRLDNLEDAGFAFLMQRVRGAEMLDLDDTDISDGSIEIVARLEYVKELRLKDCHQLTNTCMKWIHQMKTLELLHVKGTQITLDGLLQLRDLPSLKTLLFSVDSISEAQERIDQLQQQLPDCKFIVNGTPIP